MTTRTLTLPYPVSANRYWRPVRIGAHITIVPTKDAKAYRELVAAMAKSQGMTLPLDGRLALHVKLFPQRPKDWAKRAQRNPDSWDDDVRCIDLGNAEKVLSDALNRVAWIDDKQLHRITLERCEPDGEARVEVTVAPIGRVPLAPSLFEGEGDTCASNAA